MVNQHTAAASWLHELAQKKAAHLHSLVVYTGRTGSSSAEYRRTGFGWPWATKTEVRMLAAGRCVSLVYVVEAAGRARSQVL